MTIRKKLLVFIPLLLLLVSGVSALLVQSDMLVRNRYEQILERMLLYQRAEDLSETQLASLYRYLADLKPETRQQLNQNSALLSSHTALLRASGASLSDVSALPLAEQLQSLLRLSGEASSSAESGSEVEALRGYEQAEAVSSYIREEVQLLLEGNMKFYHERRPELEAQTERMSALGTALLVVITILGVIIALWISRSITIPVSRLAGMARELQSGNLNPPRPLPSSTDELGQLTRAFEDMSVGVREHVERERQLLEKDRLVKELELKSLQSQINPHFLFNTLNVISRMAMLEGAGKSSDLIVSVSSLLRYNLRKLDEPVTLKDELMQIRDYFAIQQARFRDRVKLTIEVEEESLFDLSLPALTLQPLVENAFQHGIADLEGEAEIGVKALYSMNVATVIVWDNGAGMSEETLDRLKKMEPAPSSEAHSGIGAANVFRRLELFFGRSHLLSLSSSPGKGTTITLELPLRAKEETNDPDSDRR
ncbi:Histidine kinase-, DNA gyrase B-, and HSP90-like ATPase [Paenibacillaceae bacterium GAS479]|nr:Histidine kinase-, DNA gyrase B-, and HSP90-like ATPase [Paenibacillaceae bacterium GAS479]